MAAGDVELDEAAMYRVLERSPALRRYLELIGERMGPIAQRLAPDRPTLREGYIDGFEATIGHNRHGVPVLVFANVDYKTTWIERGTDPHATNAAGDGRPVSIPASHVLERTLVIASR